MHYKYRFTVFTATYNCGHLIHRVFESLRKQTFKDFEWIVVNDGSTDNTEKIVREFETKADFPVKYYAQENKGKPAATNFGINRAEGELFIILDADDEFVDECLETFNTYDHTGQNAYGSTDGNCIYVHGTPQPTSSQRTSLSKIMSVFKNNIEKLHEIAKKNNIQDEEFERIINEISKLSNDSEDNIINIMDVMQYQDIHRQKIERVINIMRALNNYMNSLFSSSIKDEDRVNSAKYIAGDEADDILSPEEIEEILKQYT